MLNQAQEYDYRFSHIAPEKGRLYDQHFTDYKWRAFVWQREQRILDAVLTKYFSNRTIRHLDFACGTGRIIGYLIKRTQTSVGVDISESMLARCREKAPQAKIINADITKNDVLGNESFNLITAFRFFPNAQTKLRNEAIQCLAKHLTPDGLFVLNNHKNHSNLFYRLARFIGKHPTTMTTKEMEQLISSVGLKAVEVYSVGVLPANYKHILVPGCVHSLFDWVANALGIGKLLAQNVIFVCRPQGQARCDV